MSAPVPDAMTPPSALSPVTRPPGPQMGCCCASPTPATTGQPNPIKGEPAATADGARQTLPNPHNSAPTERIKKGKKGKPNN